MNAVADNDVVSEAAHGGHGGALLPLHHGCHAPFSHQPLDPAERVFPAGPVVRALPWKVQGRREGGNQLLAWASESGRTVLGGAGGF